MRVRTASSLLLAVSPCLPFASFRFVRLSASLETQSECRVSPAMPRPSPAKTRTTRVCGAQRAAPRAWHAAPRPSLSTQGAEPLTRQGTAPKEHYSLPPAKKKPASVRRRKLQTLNDVRRAATALLHAPQQPHVPPADALAPEEEDEEEEKEPPLHTHAEWVLARLGNDTCFIFHARGPQPPRTRVPRC